MSRAPAGPGIGELTGWRRTVHLKLRFGLSKLPVFPVRYRLRTSGHPDFFYHWTRVMPWMDPARGAFDFELYGWDVRELRFLRRYLAPGMTFVDIGAHYGLYAVLAAHLVGPSGRVLAFEPAAPAFRRLRWHLWLNGARQVLASPDAVGARAMTASLYRPVRGVDTTSSLHPNAIGASRLRRQEVRVTTLDEAAGSRGFAGVDLVKLDVEGAEPEVLEGAARVLAESRPLWLFEALDITAAAWGGSGRALVERFRARDHTLFEFTPDGWLQPHAVRDSYRLDSNCNLLAVPSDKLPQIEPLAAQDCSRASA